MQNVNFNVNESQEEIERIIYHASSKVIFLTKVDITYSDEFGSNPKEKHSKVLVNIDNIDVIYP
jgi:hypothetical protein